MKFKDFLHLPSVTDLGEFGKTEFKNGLADIRRALIEEGWFGQSATGLGWELPKSQQEQGQYVGQEQRSWSDQSWSRSREDRAQELDFDR